MYYSRCGAGDIGVDWKASQRDLLRGYNLSHRRISAVLRKIADNSIQYRSTPPSRFGDKVLVTSMDVMCSSKRVASVGGVAAHKLQDVYE